MSPLFGSGEQAARRIVAALPVRYRLWCFAALLGIGPILLIVAAGCGKKAEVVQVTSASFVGNEACASCHPKEFKDHKASHHLVTMRPFDKANMGIHWPKSGPIKDTHFVLYENGGGYSLGWKDDPSSAVPMQFALGSDRIAFTYISLPDAHTLIELRQSYFAPLHSWLTTPGEDFVEDRALGRSFDEENARHCLGCHSVTLPENSLTPEPRFYGVGCESCHGPGKAHIAAIQAGKTDDIQMEHLHTLGATKLNELCGRCHRTEKDITPDKVAMTQRFEPYGLMKSRCFLESGDTLSCSTCHDPHTDVSTDQKGYEKACLTCHAPASGFGPADPKRKACPVNPRSGCIPCHMPKRKLTIDQPFTMAEHYIQANPPEK